MWIFDFFKSSRINQQKSSLNVVNINPVTQINYPSITNHNQDEQKISPEYLHLYNVCINDIMVYNNCPFLIDNELLSYMHFKYIPISKHNQLICIEKINELNELLTSYLNILENNYISTNFWIDKHPYKLPNFSYFPSQIRFTPFTKTGKKAKYPVYAFLNDMDEHFGSYAIQFIYFKQDGNIGKADMYAKTQNRNIRYKVHIRERKGNLFVRRIDKEVNTNGQIKVQAVYYDNKN